ncbi:MAG: hypothetical protein ACREA2_20060 [Blastocatellia bacterium]
MNIAITLRSVHVPLPDNIYFELSAEADRINQPPALLARIAIEEWLEQRRAAALREEIAAYATRYAGTPFDLDEDFEAAGIENLSEEAEKAPARKRASRRAK